MIARKKREGEEKGRYESMTTGEIAKVMPSLDEFRRNLFIASNTKTFLSLNVRIAPTATMTSPPSLPINSSTPIATPSWPVLPSGYSTKSLRKTFAASISTVISLTTQSPPPSFFRTIPKPMLS
jgi:hypothetical protein